MGKSYGDAINVGCIRSQNHRDTGYNAEHICDRPPVII